jgi:hypothetical protein
MVEVGIVEVGIVVVGIVVVVAADIVVAADTAAVGVVVEKVGTAVTEMMNYTVAVAVRIPVVVELVFDIAAAVIEKNITAAAEIALEIGIQE